MSEYFSLSSEDTETRLKSFSGTFSGSKGTIRIQLEIDDPVKNLSYHLYQLENFQAAQKQAIKDANSPKKKSRAKRVTHQKPLALPAPEETL